MIVACELCEWWKNSDVMSLVDETELFLKFFDMMNGHKLETDGHHNRFKVIL